MRAGFRVLTRTLTETEFIALDGPFLAAGLAFYILLYCFPLLLLFVTALGFVLEGSERALAGVSDVLERLFPASEQAIEGALESFAENRGLLGAVAVISCSASPRRSPSRGGASSKRPWRARFSSRSRSGSSPGTCARRGNYAVFYGALGGVVFFVLWIYYASMTLVLAATLGAVLERGVQSASERPSPEARPRS
jgi:uncharacterized BrkB/YihY/UPF0761 family membrane protein